MIKGLRTYRSFMLVVLASLVGCLAPLQTATAQFLHFEMNIEAELGVEVIRNLDFGTALAGSGLQQVDLGDPGMGIFGVNGTQSQNIIVNIDAPDALTAASDDNTDRIPLDLQLAYNNSGKDNIERARPLLGRSTRFSLASIGSQNTQTEGWVAKTAYIYVYGSLMIGDVQEDTYTGDITLAVEYE